MNFQPETVVRLLSNVPLSLNETNQLWFDTVTAQQTYFSGKVSRTYNQFTYQRKERNYAVSYTHLDVYKRQSMLMSGRVRS